MTAAPALAVQTKWATRRQIDFIGRLCAERDTEHLTHIIGEAREDVMNRTFTSGDASALIGELLKCRKLPKPKFTRSRRGRGLYHPYTSY